LIVAKLLQGTGFVKALMSVIELNITHFLAPPEADARNQAAVSMGKTLIISHSGIDWL
jgi:hypothetical protein